MPGPHWLLNWTQGTYDVLPKAKCPRLPWILPPYVGNSRKSIYPFYVTILPGLNNPFCPALEHEDLWMEKLCLDDKMSIWMKKWQFVVTFLDEKFRKSG
jgi:hypothetical protein